ncbi:tetraacyldisaccharide 4'-kinase [Aquimarina pacifica]|uniref:tetraacyldisaccharide 4'-kinase n=1 Tax=Aquimarina pacifica TaxID=1296415 RepID=UPI000470C6CA|nr:tetraacyldisaccharide 4'-kinase [Aquimarina pacifica]
MNLLRKILFPFVPFYYLITRLRNAMYDLGIKKSTAYDIPIVAVGNLSVGGTGKSPMVEYIIRLIRDKKSLATLSRGYKRNTKGFQLATLSSVAEEIGDEPLQFKRKFPEITVAVDANRCNGIDRLLSSGSSPEVILLDDAYQHRKVKAGFYILLTAYSNLYCDDIMLPTGDLREPRIGANRADIIVVTKCPKNLTLATMDLLKDSLNIQKGQELFFSYISYRETIIGTMGEQSIKVLEDSFFTLVTGIANPQPLVDYYTSLGLKFDHISFSDHHNFTAKELAHLETLDCIITTEKDYMRLKGNILKSNMWYQPIETRFIEGADVFDRKLLEYIDTSLF